MDISSIVNAFAGGDVISDDNLEWLQKELEYAQEQHKNLEPVIPVNTYEVLGGITCGVCPRCQKGVTESDKFCHECGAKLDWSGKIH